VDDNAAARLESFAPYGAPSDDVPDPTAKALCAVTAELQALRRRLDSLEAVGRVTPAEERPRAIAVNAGPEG
jgi:hypothetical protein